jgi:hypothetical protein
VIGAGDGIGDVENGIKWVSCWECIGSSSITAADLRRRLGSGGSEYGRGRLLTALASTSMSATGGEPRGDG